MSFVSAEIPFLKFGNRQILTEQQIIEQPWLQDFINQFPLCFERHAATAIWIFYPEGDAPLAPKQKRD